MKHQIWGSSLPFFLKCYFFHAVKFIIKRRKKEMNKVIRILEIINISKPIANHMLGESHTPVHRMATGWFVITVGVLITAVGLQSSYARSNEICL